MKETIPVAVVIVSFNTKDLTKKALTALFVSSHLPAQVIVVDNNSHDDSVEMVRNYFPEVEVIANKDNLGFAKANNQAIREKVNQPYVWLLNSDTETGQNSLKQLYDYMEAHPKVGVVGPQLVYPNGDLQSVGGYFPSITNVLSYLFPVVWLAPKSFKRKLKSIAIYPQPIPEKGIEVDYVAGAACLLRKKALDEVGLLGEEYFMYFEETDLNWRLKKGGWQRRVINTEPVMHVYGGSYKSKYDKKRLKTFLESLLIFVKKNYGPSFRGKIIRGKVLALGRLSIWLRSLKNKL